MTAAEVPAVGETGESGISDKPANVYEAGLSNLLRDETQVLVHRGGEEGKPSGKVDQMLLVRVDDSDDKAGES